MRGSDGRARLLDELTAYEPADPYEMEARDRLRVFVGAHPECFERTLREGHVTGSAWVVDRSGTAVLLTHHRKLDRWLQLGGHADGESDVRAVALREATEESGLTGIAAASAAIFDVDIHTIPARGDEREHVHYDVRFAFFADASQKPVASAESHAVAWIRLDRIDDYAIDDSVRRLVAKTPALVRSAANVESRR